MFFCCDIMHMTACSLYYDSFTKIGSITLFVTPVSQYVLYHQTPASTQPLNSQMLQFIVGFSHCMGFVDNSKIIENQQHYLLDRAAGLSTFMLSWITCNRCSQLLLHCTWHRNRRCSLTLSMAPCTMQCEHRKYR